jgi:hypothetical protein
VKENRPAVTYRAWLCGGRDASARRLLVRMLCSLFGGIVSLPLATLCNEERPEPLRSKDLGQPPPLDKGGASCYNPHHLR